MKPIQVVSLTAAAIVAVFVLGRLPSADSDYSPFVRLLWSGSLVLGYVCVYVLPTIVAARRGVPNVGSLTAINLFLGWTVIGWIVALAMAVRDIPATEDSGPRSEDTVERLKELADLHARGALTEEDFASAKARLLG